MKKFIIGGMALLCALFSASDADSQTYRSAGSKPAFKTVDGILQPRATQNLSIGETLTVGGEIWSEGDILYHGTSYVLDGVAEDKQSIYLTTNAGNVYFEVEKVGGGDIEYVFDEREYDLDCTTGAGAGGRAQVMLDEGTATIPVRSYLYVIPAADGSATLMASTTLPSGDFCWVGMATIQSDTEVDTQSALQLQRMNEAFKSDGRGQLSYIREKIRWLGAKYLSGISQTLDITGAVVDLTVSSGVVYQLHRNSWPTLSIANDGVYVANASGVGTLTEYEKITNLDTIAEFSDGSSIPNNQRFPLTIWGSMNSSDGATSTAKLFVNLPLAGYNSDSAAIADSSNYAVRTAPAAFTTTAFLISSVVLKAVPEANEAVGNGVFSLLGNPLGSVGGGAGSVAETEFSDSLFTVYDDGDATKAIKLQADGITTGTTRTYTVQDKSGTLAMTSDNYYDKDTDDINDVSAYLSESGTVVNYKGVELGTGGGGGDAVWFDDGDAGVKLTPSAYLRTVQIATDLSIGNDLSVGVNTLVVTGSNVGIGTTAPLYKLHTKENSKFAAVFERAQAETSAMRVPFIVLHSSSSNMSDGFGSGIEFAIQDSSETLNQVGIIGAVRAGADNTADMIFMPRMTGKANERMRITAGGNVGIGTSDPDSKLDVFGDLSVSNNVSISKNLSVNQNVDVTGTVTIDGDLNAFVDTSLDTAATVVLTREDCLSGIRINDDADVIDYTLPTAEAGLSIVIYGEATGVITVDCQNASDIIVLDGIALAAGNAIDSAGNAGDYASFVAVDDTRWHIVGKRGTWVDGGAD